MYRDKERVSHSSSLSEGERGFHAKTSDRSFWIYWKTGTF